MTSRRYWKGIGHIDEDDYQWSDDDDDDDDDTESYGRATEAYSSSPSPGFSLSDAFKTSATICHKEESRHRTTDGTVVTPKISARVPYSDINLPAEEKPELPKLRRYLGQQSSADLLSALSDDALVLITRFLPLRSVAAMGCVNRSLDAALSSDFLFCRSGEEVEGEEPSPGGSRPDHFLSSLRSVPVLFAGYQRPKGVARKFAFEADVYSRSKAAARRFHLVDQVYNVRANNITFVGQDTIAYTTDSSAEVTTRNIFTSETVSSGPPNSRCLRSTFGGKSQGRSLCAIVTADNTGSQNGRHLSLKELSPLSGGDTQTHRVLWQREVDGMFLGNIALEFNRDNETLLLGTASGSHVLDTRTGKEVWSLDEALEAPLLHEKLVIGTVGDFVKIFDIRCANHKHLACAQLPSHGALRPTQFAVRNGQLWMTMHYGLHRSTDFIMRNIDAHQGRRKSVDFTMKKVARRVHELPVLATGNEKLYVACGDGIAAYDSRMLLSKSWATYKACPVANMIVGDTKLVYTRQTPNFNSENSFPITMVVQPIDAFAQTQPDAHPSFSVTSPYFPRFNRTSSSCSINTLALGGNFIAASYSYSTNHKGTGGEIRVMDLQRLDEDYTSYVDAKARSERWTEEEDRIHLREWRARNSARRKKAAESEQEKSAEEERRERDAVGERKQKIIARKDAKKQLNRGRKSKARAESKTMAHSRGEKEFR
mmetsp:Transcript_35923/g.107339  ORF Transcript_35923/g.107339 Transcript_35923/m.107339 type:complete len:711 (-) Transcript_35923:425-2557(-)